MAVQESPNSENSPIEPILLYGLFCPIFHALSSSHDCQKRMTKVFEPFPSTECDFSHLRIRHSHPLESGYPQNLNLKGFHFQIISTAFALGNLTLLEVYSLRAYKYKYDFYHLAPCHPLTSIVIPNTKIDSFSKSSSKPSPMKVGSPFFFHLLVFEISNLILSFSYSL